MTNPTFTWDDEAQAGYLRLRDIRPGEISRTLIVDADESVLLDLDQDGRVLGVEILGA